MLILRRCFRLGVMNQNSLINAAWREGPERSPPNVTDIYTTEWGFTYFYDTWQLLPLSPFLLSHPELFFTAHCLLNGKLSFLTLSSRWLLCTDTSRPQLQLFLSIMRLLKYLPRLCGNECKSCENTVSGTRVIHPH